MSTHALTWLRGPKCVASSSPLDRIRASLECTGLLRFFEPYLFSASDVMRGKPAPDLFIYVASKMRVAPSDCIVVEDSPAGVTAAHAAGMVPIGFIGGSHTNPGLGAHLTNAGARAVIADMIDWGVSAGQVSGTYSPPSRASPASVTSIKLSGGASPRVET